MEKEALPNDSHAPLAPPPPNTSQISMQMDPVDAEPVAGAPGCPQGASSSTALPSPLPPAFQSRGRKRPLAGKLACQLDNVKAARLDEFQKYLPHPRTTQAYENSFQRSPKLPESREALVTNSRSRRYCGAHITFFVRYQFPHEKFDGIPHVPTYDGFQMEVALQQALVPHKIAAKSVYQSGIPSAPESLHNPTDTRQGGPSGLTRTVSWISSAPLPGIPRASGEVLLLLKRLRQHHRQEAELMSDDEAIATWISLSEEERYHVLQMYSRHTAQAQIAASEAAFKSVPTSHIVAPQNVMPSQTRQVAPVSQQQSPVARELDQPDCTQLTTEFRRTAPDRELSNPLDAGDGEPSPRPAPQASTTLCQTPIGFSVQAPPQALQSPPPERQPTDYDHEMFDDDAYPQAPQVSPSIVDNQPISADGMNALPFANDQVDIGREPEYDSTPRRDKGKARAINSVDASSEAQYANGSTPPGSPPIRPHASRQVSPAATESMPAAMGHTLGPQPTSGPGDQSGNLTGGIIALLFNELRELNTNVRENSELQRKAIDAILGLQSDGMQSTAWSGSPGPSRASQTTSRRTRTPVQTVRARKLNNPSLRVRQKQKRVAERVARWQGDEDDTNTDPAVVEKNHLNRLRARVRNLLQSMLGIEDWMDSAVLFPTLTQEQIKKFDKGELACTSHEFFIDFDNSWSKFKPNRVARQVFVDHYFARVAGGGYLKNPTPEHLLTREVVERILDNHMPYCRLRWRQSKEPLTQEKVDAIKARAAKNSRKNSLHFSRSVIVRRHGDLRHVQLWLLLEPGNMDGDEPEGGQKKKFPVVFNILRPTWASQELCNYWWSLDAEYRTHYGNPTHERATRGNPPRDRVLPEDSVEDGIPPIGLWRNCYDQAWLDSLEPHLRREFEIIDEDFDFSFETNLASPAATDS